MEGFVFVYIRYKLVLLFYHYRARGDVVAITNQNGQVVANYEYDLEKCPKGRRKRNSSR
ncbi:hypothetical protein bcgnr5391_31740 [Bacillus cereus]